MANYNYELRTVPLTHPLAMRNGSNWTKYGWAKAYGHKLKVYEVLGELSIQHGSCIHHRDEDKKNNDLKNLIWFRKRGDHSRLHCHLRRGDTEAEALATLDPADYRCFDPELYSQIITVLKDGNL